MFKVNNKNFTPCSSVSIVNFEHIIAGWVDNDLEKSLAGRMLRFQLRSGKL